MNTKEERKIGDCGLCKKKNVEGEASEYVVDFICAECIDIRDKWNALDNMSFIRLENK